MGSFWLSFNLVGRSSSISIVGETAFGLGGGGEAEIRFLGGGSPRYLVDGFLRSDISTTNSNAVYGIFALEMP